MSSPVDWDDYFQTEIYEDDGFVYRRKRRRLSDNEPPSNSASASAQPDLKQERMLWKKRKLSRLVDEYRMEIQSWEFLTDSLRKMEEGIVSVGEGVELGDGAVLVESEETDSGSGSDAVRVVDELLVKVEVQEATISHVSNLCDAAESLCSELEEQRNKLFVDLSIWESSPKKLMAILCD